MNDLNDILTHTDAHMRMLSPITWIIILACIICVAPTKGYLVHEWSFASIVVDE